MGDITVVSLPPKKLHGTQHVLMSCRFFSLKPQGLYNQFGDYLLVNEHSYWKLPFTGILIYEKFWFSMVICMSYPEGILTKIKFCLDCHNPWGMPISQPTSISIRYAAGNPKMAQAGTLGGLLTKFHGWRKPQINYSGNLEKPGVTSHDYHAGKHQKPSPLFRMNPSNPSNPRAQGESHLWATTGEDFLHPKLQMYMLYMS